MATFLGSTKLNQLGNKGFDYLLKRFFPELWKEMKEEELIRRNETRYKNMGIDKIEKKIIDLENSFKSCHDCEEEKKELAKKLMYKHLSLAMFFISDENQKGRTVLELGKAYDYAVICGFNENLDREGFISKLCGNNL